MQIWYFLFLYSFYFFLILIFLLCRFCGLCVLSCGLPSLCVCVVISSKVNRLGVATHTCSLGAGEAEMEVSPGFHVEMQNNHRTGIIKTQPHNVCLLTIKSISEYSYCLRFGGLDFNFVNHSGVVEWNYLEYCRLLLPAVELGARIVGVKGMWLGRIYFCKGLQSHLTLYIKYL